MFSVLRFTSYATLATSLIAARSNLSVTPSVSSSAVYCLMRAFLGWVKIFMKSFSVRSSISTRIGNRPWSSGIRSEGLLIWKAPAARNNTWSVWTTPYLVTTLLPSTIGRISRCTPSLETSGPAAAASPAILSSSSTNTIPISSTRCSASRITSSISISLPASSVARILRPSATVVLWVRRFFGKTPPNIS